VQKYKKYEKQRRTFPPKVNGSTAIELNNSEVDGILHKEFKIIIIRTSYKVRRHEQMNCK
jgi:hypothetical protein